MLSEKTKKKAIKYQRMAQFWFLSAFSISTFTPRFLNCQTFSFTWKIRVIKSLKI